MKILVFVEAEKFRNGKRNGKRKEKREKKKEERERRGSFVVFSTTVLLLAQILFGFLKKIVRKRW